MSFHKIFTLPEEWEHTHITKTYRKACRGIVLDKDSLIPLLFVGKDNYHKLPWWWIEWDEDKIEAFKREILEEAWCEIEEIQEVWSVIERNSTWEQTSYCYIWKVIKRWIENFTSWEVEKWYLLKRVTIKEALSLIKKDIPRTEWGRWRQQRDLYILQEIDKICS